MRGRAGRRRVGPRGPARDADAAARRARDAVRGTWQRLTLAQRGALRAAVLEDGRELLSADVRVALPAERRVDGPGVARRAGARRHPRPRRRPLRRRRLAAARVGGAEDVLMALLDAHSVSADATCGPGRCTTGPTPRSRRRSSRPCFPIYLPEGRRRRTCRESVATSRFAWATTLAILIVAIVAPLLGAIADYARSRSGCSACSSAIGASATAAMYWIERGDWAFALVLFVIGNVGVAGSIVFYESLLPHLVGEKELDRVSTAGYAIGYIGGGVAARHQPADDPEARRWFGIPDAGVATRLSLASVAVWWVLFSIPLFRQVPEPPARIEADERPGENALRTGVRRLVETFQRAAALPRGVRVPARVPPLQRRHPDHDPDGDDSTAPRSACRRAR